MHESICKVRHCGSGERQAGFDPAVSGLASKRDCLKIVKMHGMIPLKSVCGSKGIEMELEDINSETLKCEIGAMVEHDFMYDPDASDFVDTYKKKELAPVTDPDAYLYKEGETNV